MKTPQLLLLTLFFSAIVLSACGGETTAEQIIVQPTEAPESTEVTKSSGDSVSEVKVSIVDSSFESKKTTVTVGTTVVWTQNGNYPHTVTLDNGSYDSGDLSSGDIVSFTFTEAGTYTYYCSYHGAPDGQGMSGVIIVVE